MKKGKTYQGIGKVGENRLEGRENGLEERRSSVGEEEKWHGLI
jgi:hypothetical protein